MRHISLNKQITVFGQGYFMIIIYCPSGNLIQLFYKQITVLGQLIRGPSGNPTHLLTPKCEKIMDHYAMI